MPRMTIEPTISVFEREKTVHALDRASTVISPSKITFTIIDEYWKLVSEKYWSLNAPRFDSAIQMGLKQQTVR
jgi:hypothetical protein